MVTVLMAIPWVLEALYALLAVARRMGHSNITKSLAPSFL